MRARARTSGAARRPGPAAQLRHPGASRLARLPRPTDLEDLPPAWRGASFERSPLDPGRLYARQGAGFIKLAVGTACGAAPARRQDLRGEAELLDRCRGLPGIPRILGFAEGRGWQALVLERIPHPPLSRLEVGWRQVLLATARLALVVVRLARRGVSHGDLRPENVLVGPDGRIWLVDFDQATRASFVGCLIANFLGIHVGGIAMQNSIGALVREHVQGALPPGLIRLLRGRRARRLAAEPQTLPPLPAEASPELRLLHEAWRISAASNASGPGLGMAYYELSFEGHHLPGERPWAERWKLLRRATAYAGRRVLELGCNSGLLAACLLREAGAQAVLAVDRDPEILAAAAKVAQAFGVRPDLRCVDFDRDPGWEDGLARFRPDVVFALSVLNWLTDPDRFLAFLARFDEVMFEGHQSFAKERRRLVAAGFAAVELIGTSERGRPVMLCRRRLTI